MVLVLDSLAVSPSLYVEQTYLCICYYAEQNVQTLVNIGGVFGEYLCLSA
jgi:hypothetical protein